MRPLAPENAPLRYSYFDEFTIVSFVSHNVGARILPSRGLPFFVHSSNFDFYVDPIKYWSTFRTLKYK